MTEEHFLYVLARFFLDSFAEDAAGVAEQVAGYGVDIEDVVARAEAVCQDDT